MVNYCLQKNNFWPRLTKETTNNRKVRFMKETKRAWSHSRVESQIKTIFRQAIEAESWTLRLFRSSVTQDDWCMTSDSKKNRGWHVVLCHYHDEGYQIVNRILEMAGLEDAGLLKVNHGSICPKCFKHSCSHDQRIRRISVISIPSQGRLDFELVLDFTGVYPFK